MTGSPVEMAARDCLVAMFMEGPPAAPAPPPGHLGPEYGEGVREPAQGRRRAAVLPHEEAAALERAGPGAEPHLPPGGPVAEASLPSWMFSDLDLPELDGEMDVDSGSLL